jgi:hypothetical protein
LPRSPCFGVFSARWRGGGPRCQEDGVGLKFRYKRTRCTGSYKDRPLLEVRWSTEEGSYSLDDLIAGDLGLGEPPLPAALRGGAVPPAPPAPLAHRGVDPATCTDVCSDAATARGTIVFAGPAPGNALALRRTAVRVRVLRDGETDGEEPPGLLDARV